ncbi:MAG TPA: iron ABC transporter substrate-binding protein [Chloroflexi bacterium]|nr:iron ABC transporter substrate-binding protein [Chloroflexota bacterium]
MNNKKVKFSRILLSLIIASGLLLVSCQPEVVEVEVEKEVVVEKEVEVVKEADPGSLVVYSGRSESLVQPIIDQFAAVTGIEVEVKYGKTAEMAAVLMEEGKNSPADVFWAQDPGGAGAVAEAGMFAELPADTLAKVDSGFQSKNGDWVGVSGRARVVVYNTATIDPATDLPDDLWGFVEPEWKGRLGWAPTNGSFQAMVTALRSEWGEEKTKEWLQGIMANDVGVYPKNTPQVAAAAAGEIDIGFVNHYYLHRFIAAEGESFAARNHFLTGGGPGSLVMVATIGRISTGANEANAMKFVEFLLSPVAQQYFAGQTYEYPLVEGVKIHRELTPIAELPKIDIDLSDLVDLQGTVDLLTEVGALE